MQKNDFIYAIPSYKRANKQITVNYLSNAGISKERIAVFVQTEEDEQEYRETIGEKANHKLGNSQLPIHILPHFTPPCQAFYAILSNFIKKPFFHFSRVCDGVTLILTKPQKHPLTP